MQDNDDEKTINLIVPLLLDSSSLVRAVAVDYLDDKHWSPASDELIAAQCVAKQAWLRCQTLGEAALKPLLTAAQDKDPEVRKSAGDALVVLDWQPKTVAEQAQYCVIRNDWKKCQELGDAAVDSLIKDLDHVDIDVRVNVIKTLASIGSIRAVPALALYIEAPEQEVRKAVVESFAYFDTKKVIPPLIIALDDTAYDIRLSAVNSLQANIH
ncbi:MAG: HEAT repeat domain-containing protein, partial [Thiohalomonadales bacterium]